MTARAQLQWAYEIAFHPARLNAVWNDWERGRVSDLPALRAAVEWAWALHQRLPEAPAVAARALRRLAAYQANARLYRMPTILRRFREKLGANDPVPVEVPAWMVRDIALPVLGRVGRSLPSDGSRHELCSPPAMKMCSPWYATAYVHLHSRGTG